MHIGVVRIRNDILHDLKEVGLVDVYVTRIVWISPRQLLRVWIKIVVEKCHLNLWFVLLELFLQRCGDLPSDLLEHVVSFSCELWNLGQVFQLVNLVHYVAFLLLEISPLKYLHRCQVLHVTLIFRLVFFIPISSFRHNASLFIPNLLKFFNHGLSWRI